MLIGIIIIYTKLLTAKLPGCSSVAVIARPCTWTIAHFHSAVWLMVVDVTNNYDIRCGSI